MLMLDLWPQAENQALHTSERTIVPRTVIFAFVSFSSVGTFLDCVQSMQRQIGCPLNSFFSFLYLRFIILLSSISAKEILQLGGSSR